MSERVEQLLHSRRFQSMCYSLGAHHRTVTKGDVVEACVSQYGERCCSLYWWRLPDR